MLDFAWALYLAEKTLSDLLGYEKVLKSLLCFLPFVLPMLLLQASLISFTLAA